MTTSFEQLQIHPDFLRCLHQADIRQATPIQSEAIPVLLTGQDAVLQSQTGTGKTLAYLLPALQRIDPLQKQLQVVILAPTRELGVQIMLEVEKLTADGMIRAQALIGGAALSRQVEKLKLHPHLVVGTPGRILELMKLRKLSLHHVKLVVIDEVDQVFELGAKNEAEAVLKGVLRTSQLVFVSATIPEAIAASAHKWMREPRFLNIQSAQRTADTLEHVYFVSEERDKIDTLRRLVRLINPPSAIVFINATADVAEVVGKLQYVGLSVEALYGEASKQDRAKVMNAFRERKFQLLLATDIAARGLDIEGVTHVFHLDPAVNAEHYLHRVGRTGRMGRKGTAISIVTVKERFILGKFEKALGITIAPKAMYQGRIVEPAQDRSAAAMRSRRMEAARQGGGVSAARSGTARGGSAPEETARVSAAAPGRRGAAAALPEKPGAAAKPAAPAGKAGGRKAERERDRKSKGAPRWLKAKQSQD